MHIVSCADHLVESLSCDVDFAYCREIINSLDGYKNEYFRIESMVIPIYCISIS